MAAKATKATRTASTRAASSRHGDRRLGLFVSLPQTPSAPSVEDFALAYFCRNNACSAAVCALTDVPSPSAQQAVLITCMKALGSATCAIAHGSTQLSLDAGRLYSASLAAINEALTSPSTAQSDDVLRAVMILCAYDTTSNSPLQLIHQSAHIHGCAALLGARGVGQMQTAHGRVLFVQACVNVVSHCTRTCSLLPSVIHRLTELSVPYFDEYKDRSIWIAHQVRLKVTDYHFEYSNNQINVDSAVRDLLHLDSELKIYVKRKTWDVAYDLPASELPAKSPMPTWHQFQELSIYQTLCAYRIMVHLFIRKLTHTHVPESAENWAAQHKFSVAVVDEHQRVILSTTSQRVSCALELSKDIQAPSQTEVCQTEVYAFDVLSPPLGISHADAAMANVAIAEKLSGNKGNLSEECEPAILRLSRGYGLIWQLMLVGVTTEDSSSTRLRAIDLLRSTGQDLAIPQAIILADRLEKG